MPRAISNKNYRTFVKGMITEASPLTYPEEASLSEDNCIVFSKGNRVRRLGFEMEENGVLVGPPVPYSDFSRTSEYLWEAVNETGERDFLVQRMGKNVSFFNGDSDTLSTTKHSFVLDLSAYEVDTPVHTLDEAHISITAGKGFLFLVGETIDPISVEYLEETDEFIVRRITIRIRDFTGVDDGLANDFEPPSLSDEHHYNLLNQGWVGPSSKIGNTTGTGDNTQYTQNSLRFSPFFGDIFGGFAQSAAVDSSLIQQYKNSIGVYPGNNKAWWVGKLEVADPERNLEVGDFDPEILCNTYFGNTRAARGHFILDAFNRDRSVVSDIQNLPSEVKRNRPSSAAFFSGRVFYGHESDIYYSQTLQDFRQAGNCFQEADPTSEGISDLIATDGGVIPLPEAYNIKKLSSVGGSLLVFAENGIWSVQGGNGGFSATDISVSKISSNGIYSPDSLVQAEGSIFWWSPSGIMSLSQQSGLFGTQEGVFDRQNISEMTIQSFYHNAVDADFKEYVKGIYNPAQNLIQWMFKSPEATFKHPATYDRILNLDLSLQAFYPWTINDSHGCILTGVFKRTRINQVKSPGIQTQEGYDTFNSLIKYTFVKKDGSTLQYSFGDFTAQNYADFGIHPYTSYLEAGYEILEDLMRNKQSNYVFLYFRRTDSGSEGIPSSCFFRTKWDWSRNESSNRWSRKVQGYRITERFKDAVVVATKHKARGHGRAIQTRFESSEIGSTFDLLGWATHFTGNTTV